MRKVHWKSPYACRTSRSSRKSSSRPSPDIGRAEKICAFRTAVAASATLAPAGVSDAEHAAPVVGILGALNQTVPLESADGVRDTRRVNLQPCADPTDRQRPAAGEPQQHQHLVTGERQPEWLQGSFNVCEEDLLDTHDRRDDGHSFGGIGPAAGIPVRTREADRIVAQRLARSHASTVCRPRRPGRTIDACRPSSRARSWSSPTAAGSSNQRGTRSPNSRADTARLEVWRITRTSAAIQTRRVAWPCLLRAENRGEQESTACT